MLFILRDTDQIKCLKSPGRTINLTVITERSSIVHYATIVLCNYSEVAFDLAKL